MSYISIQHLWKKYGDKVVLENISLEVPKGEFVTIVGASGCGKTTFLKMLLGEEAPSKGEFKLEGKSWPNEPDKTRGVVFQRYSVFPHLTVLKNVLIALELPKARLSGRLFGRARADAQEKSIKMLESVGLGQALNKFPHELSGGMQQRLALAQALIANPAVLLLDEPFGALDPGIRADMHELVLRLHRELNLTVFMITHDLSEAFKLGTRLLVFDRVRVDPHAPDAYGAKVTYDIPLKKKDRMALYELADIPPLKSMSALASMA
ncbi:MAG TPA: ABC transporter ATP-binding protein [Pseudomonadales bacterium]|nr:ABC transporter ATP-binding protein [Pseudomonadales bacterium]